MKPINLEDRLIQFVVDVIIMCKKRIEKAAFSVKGVKSADWHIDDQILHLIINEEKCSVTEVKQAIIKVGHDAEDLKATNEDYDKLHGCCRYERK